MLHMLWQPSKVVRNKKTIICQILHYRLQVRELILWSIGEILYLWNESLCRKWRFNCIGTSRSRSKQDEHGERLRNVRSISHSEGNKPLNTNSSHSRDKLIRSRYDLISFYEVYRVLEEQQLNFLPQITKYTINFFNNKFEFFVWSQGIKSFSFQRQKNDEYKMYLDGKEII